MENGESTLEDIQDLVGRELGGRYLLEKFIDRGGYGAVYRGTDKKFNQPVAVKVGFSTREFVREAQLAAQVRHNHIVQVTDYGSDAGLAYLVMEFLQGEDLEKLFKRQDSRLSLDQVRKLINEVGDALEYAHAERLIHRDLKPKNIILKQQLSKSGTNSGTTKFVLLDFGIASKLDAEGTQRNRTQDGAGTVEYMAPELLGRDPKATTQSDIYAFGVILYQMLAGRTPFPQLDTSRLALANCLNAISKADPPRFREICVDREYPAGLEELVLECLEKNPERRPQTIAEVRQRSLEIIDRDLNLLRNLEKNRSQFRGTIRPGDLQVGLGDENAELGNLPDGRVRSRGTNRIAWFGLLLVAIAAVAMIEVQNLIVQRPVPVVSLTDVRGNSIEEGQTLIVEAGKSVTLTFAVSGLSKDVEIRFASRTELENVTTELSDGPIPGTSKYFRLLIPELNSHATNPTPVTFEVKTKAQDKPHARTFQLSIQRPTPWLPPDCSKLGFRESSDSWLCQIGDQVYASIIEREIAGDAVRFRLVPSARADREIVDTFYAAERPVSRGLFRQFAKAQRALGNELRRSEETDWESMENLELPMTDVYPLEAQECALWLAGRVRGTLPSTTEWEMASGYWDFRRSLESGGIKTQQLADLKLILIPNLPNRAKVWIGSSPTVGGFQGFSGPRIDGRSPYGCDFTQLNSICELTRTLWNHLSERGDLLELCKNGVPNSDDPVFQKKYQVALRGSWSDENEKNEMTWLKGQEVKTVDDLDSDAASFSLAPGKFAKSARVGFRVVILTNRQ